MKAVLSLAMGLAVIAATSTVSYAQSGMSMQRETIQGVLVDTKCYGMMPDKNAGNDHVVPGKDGAMTTAPKCAMACATMGIPVALKTADNRTIVLAAPASQLTDVMAQEVSLEGMYSTDRATFIVTRVIPKSGEAFDIKTMM